MRKTIIRFLHLFCIVLLLFFLAFIVLIRFYPYTYNFPTYPRTTQTKSGAAGDPINLVFIGSQGQIMYSFHRAGWLIPDPITRQTSEKIAVDSLAHRRYPTAPVSPLYAFGRIQDLAFEKPTNDVQNRDHIRLWKTGTRIDGQLVWIGQASQDRGIELSATTHFPTHHIAPTVDLERSRVGTDLQTTGLVAKEADGTFTAPIFFARNGGGDFYESDGDILVITYTPVPIQLAQPVGVVAHLKNGFFLFYDTLETSFLLAVAVCIGGLLLVVVGLWPCLRWLFQKIGLGTELNSRLKEM